MKTEKQLKNMVHKITYTLIPLLLAVLAVYAVYSVVVDPAGTPEISIVDEKKVEKTAEEEKQPGANITVNEPEISHLVDGKVTWKVYAESINSDTGSGDTFLEHSRGIFFREKDNDEVRFEFNAPMTVYNSKTKEVSASSGVLGKLFPEMIELKAENLEWNEEAGKLVADIIFLETKDTKIQGKKMVLRPDDRHITLSGGVEAEFKTGGSN